MSRPFVIGLYAVNTPEATAAILSILSIPATYCPLKKGPPKWVWSIINNAGINVMLIQLSLIEELLDWHCINWYVSLELIQYGFVLISMDLSSFSEEVPADDVFRGANEISNRQLAYMIHTSGTTGRPKQVWVPHSSIVPNITDLMDIFKLNSDDRILNAAPLTFDPSIVEIFITLSVGGTLVMVPHVVKMSPHLFTRVVLKRHRVTVLQVTPSLVRQLPLDLIRDVLLGPRSGLRILAFGGEPCPGIGTLKEWKSSQNATRLFNLYGITEVSCWASCHEIAQEDPLSCDDDSVAIGNSLSGTMIELRDPDGNAVTSSGRIFIGGADRVCCLGDEMSLVPGTIRDSGDNGRMDDQGNMHVMGRSDRQIKRYGQRINLDSIQEHLMRFPLISSCCLITSQSKLIVVIVPSVSMSHDRLNQLIRQEMIDNLPSEGIPDEIIITKEIPINEHGWLDGWMDGWSI
jgi:acyl-CoA synthetase